MLLVRKLWKSRMVIFYALAILAVMTSSITLVKPAMATPGGGGVKVEKLADGYLAENAMVKFLTDGRPPEEVAEMQVYKITLPPGSFTGWHQHGGTHMIIVTAGTLTYYRGDDPTCSGEKYTIGNAILDTGFHTHFARNDGTVDVVTYVTQWLPKDNPTFRIDAPAPGNCDF